MGLIEPPPTLHPLSLRQPGRQHSQQRRGSAAAGPLSHHTRTPQPQERRSGEIVDHAHLGKHVFITQYPVLGHDYSIGIA